ncbi:MAG: ARMT1-like domain-containing protein [Candidatus Methanoperedens sp.]|nr:ARMT1-like domain-containing protein [Candidatus Methanoperedens sp.]
MNVHLECIFCIQRQALEAVRLVTDDMKRQEKILRMIMDELLEMSWNTSPPEIADVVYRIVRKESKEDDPYKTLEKDFRIYDFSEFVQALEKSQNITYVADNAGEIVFDKILLETIMREYNIRKILFAVKGTPFINDATLEDAVYVGIDRIPGIEIINIGVNETGMKRSSEAFLNIIATSDIIISKGQGNYEALTDQKNIFFMLIAKCPIIARDLGVNVGDIVLKRNLG